MNIMLTPTIQQTSVSFTRDNKNNPNDLVHQQIYATQKAQTASIVETSFGKAMQGKIDQLVALFTPQTTQQAKQIDNEISNFVQSSQNLNLIA